MEVSSNGLTVRDVTMMACDVFDHAMLLPSSEWDRRNDQERWEHVAVKAMVLMDPGTDQLPRDVNVNVKDMARALYQSYSMGEDVMRWQDVPLESKLGWEAVVRHLFGALTSDDLSTVQDYSQARKWVESQLVKQGVLV